jgi:GH15 family glucan-1,4-alpha-glucosidase
MIGESDRARPHGPIPLLSLSGPEVSRARQHRSAVLKGGDQLDASLLMMPLVRFVSATDPVWLKTLDAIGEFLCDDGMIYRYQNDDELEGGEGAFTTCAFSYVECLARAGRLDEARLAMT